MSSNDFSFERITYLSKLFCEECFKTDENDNTRVENAKEKLDELVCLIEKNNSNDFFQELIFVFVERGAEKAFLKHALKNTGNAKKATSGITEDSEFQNFLDLICKKYDENSRKREIVELINIHLLSEINDLSSEVNITSMNAYNAISTTFLNDINSATSNVSGISESVKQNEKKISNLMKIVNETAEQSSKKTRKLFNNFSEKLNAAERKSHESSITILGIFSAIVLVFNATVGFYQAAIEAFSDASLYKILFILIIIGIILTNVLMGLFCYLEKIRNPKKLSITAKTSNKSSEIESEDNTKSKGLKIKFKKNNILLPFCVANIVLFLLLGVLVTLRNSDVISIADRKITWSITASQTKEPNTSVTVGNIDDITHNSDGILENSNTDPQY